MPYDIIAKQDFLWQYREIGHLYCEAQTFSYY